MARIARRKPFSEKNVAEVSSTIAAENFCPVTVGVRHPGNRTLNLLVETWPPAVGIELVFRPVQRGITALACIETGCFVHVVSSGKRAFRALADNYAFLFGRQRIQGGDGLELTVALKGRGPGDPDGGK